MGAQGKSPSSVNSMQRVKVYRLSDDGKWEDRGTGHVTVDYLERSEDLGLFVIDEEDNDTLLVHRIASDEIYRKQEDTIISWRDPDFSTELALSFQESTGCAYIWDHICTVQRNLQFNALSNVESGSRPTSEGLEASGASQTNDETYQNIGSDLRDFPAVELSTLPLILKTVVESGVSDQMRAVDLILHEHDFFPKLMELFRICEDLENIDGLHMIFKIVKGIIMLNSPQIFDKIFGEEFFMDVIGCLEYDPDVRQVQNHRSFLKEHVVFKEAIPIKDPIVLSRIHQTYRVGYIKDVILPRVLDDATVANLNSIIHGNNAVVVSLLKDDSTFIQELFARMKSPTTSEQSKKNLVLFLQEYCSLSKSLQLVQQLRLFRDLVSEGIFDIITDVLQSLDKRLVLTGTDILLLFLNQDPNLLRTYVIQQEGNTLLGLLVKGMLTDFGDDMHCQFLEIIRILLDSYTLSGSQRDTIVEIFYDKYLDQLIEVIVVSCPPKGDVHLKVKGAGSCGYVEKHTATKPEILSNICELLCFCVLHHPYRIKCNFILNNVIDKVLFLTRRKERYLVVAAVRFLRTIISRNDEHLLRHVVKCNTLKPIVEVFVDNGNRYNLLHSAILELFEYIRKENLKTLIVHIVDTFWDQLVKFEHLGSIQALKVKYEQLLESSETRNAVSVTDPRKRIDDRALEKEEEDYFNEDSDEEDSASVRTSNARSQPVPHVLPNGTGGSYPSFRPGAGLVDYEDDEDDEDYNPPNVNKQEVSSVDEKRSDSFKLKRRSSVVHDADDEEQLELSKKHRVEKNTNGGTITIVAPCSTCTRGSSPSRKVVPSNNPRHRDDSSGPDPASGEMSSAVSRNCAKCSPDAADTRQTEIPVGNSSADTAVSGPKVTGSMPYSVR